MSEWYWPSGRPGDAGDGGGDDDEGYLAGPGFAGGPQTPGWPGWLADGPAGEPGDGPGAEPDGGDGPWPEVLTGPWDPPGDDPDAGPWQPDPAATAPYPRAGHGHRRPRRRAGWLAVLAPLLAGGLAAAAFIAATRHPARPAPAPASSAPSPARTASPGPPGSPPPAITLTAARQLLARYLTANNAANRARSDAGLAAIEGGSSYQLDAGAYQSGSAADPDNTSYQPLAFTTSAWYIPRLAAYPRWFAVRGTWTPARTAAYRGYLLFAQAAPGARWLEVLEPTVTASAAPVPAAGPDGYATAIPADQGAGLAAAPAAVPAATAAALDGAVAPALPVTGVLATADQRDQQFWAARVPRDVTVSLRHSPGPYGVYALAARGGGAIVFYGVSAALTLTAPPGQQISVQIPGYYSGTAVSTAAVPYQDQYAAWIPARPGQAVRVLAQASGTAASST